MQFSMPSKKLDMPRLEASLRRRERVQLQNSIKPYFIVVKVFPNPEKILSFIYGSTAESSALSLLRCDEHAHVSV